MDRDYYDFIEDIPNEIRDIAAFLVCFHLSPVDIDAF